MVQTTQEFTGETIWLVVGILFCIPAAIYYYFTNREERKVCPECATTADMAASTCPNCNADISE